MAVQVNGKLRGTINVNKDEDDEIGKIVPVTDSSSTDSNGEEDYSTYYPSYCITYFNINTKDSSGNFVSVNQEEVRICRYITEQDPPSSSPGFNTTPSYAVINFGVSKDGLATIVQYARLSDNVIKYEITPSE